MSLAVERGSGQKGSAALASEVGSISSNFKESSGSMYRGEQSRRYHQADHRSSENASNAIASRRGKIFQTFNMVGLARREADKFSMQNVCEFRVGDFFYMELGEKFDITLAIGVFDYLPDPVSFLRKMVSVTTGKVIASFAGHSFLRKPARKLRYRLLGKGTVYFYSEADVRRLVEQAGLRDSQIIPIRSSGSGFILLGGS